MVSSQWGDWKGSKKQLLKTQYTIHLMAAKEFADWSIVLKTPIVLKKRKKRDEILLK